MVDALLGYGHARSVARTSPACPGNLWSFLRTGVDVGSSTRITSAIGEAHGRPLDYGRPWNPRYHSAWRHRTRPGPCSLPHGACGLCPELWVGDVVVGVSYDRY